MTHITKGRDGWEALDRVPMAAGRILRITTHKWQNGGISSCATSVKPAEDGLGYSFILFTDFYKTLKTDRTVRCTEKTISQQHATVMAGIADLLAQANAQYEAQEVAA